MVFSSTTFLLAFLPLVGILYFICPRKLRNALLLVFSLLFYGWGEPKYILIMLFSTVFDYCNGLAIGHFRAAGKPKGAKAVLVVSVVGNLSILGFFKYTDFAITNLNGLLGTAIPALGLLLPIGISFYTFQTMSYTIDVYRGLVPPQRNIIDFSAYVTLFPQLIAGPIVQYKTVAADLENRNRESLAGASAGMQRFVIGLGKKVLLANQMGAVWEEIAAMSAPSVVTAWLGALAFTFQIYFDFSGYSDMAIGLGRLFGFRFLENFNYPYESRTVTEFWRRWHISLGSWFRDYVYIPMGGSRVSRWRWVINILTVWMLTGLWHGAAWNFVLWGLLFAGLLLAEKWIPALQRLPGVLRHGYVLLAVVLSFVLFNADSLAQAGQDFAGLFGFGGLSLTSAETLYYLKSYAVLFALGILGSTPVVKNAARRMDGTKAGAVLEAAAMLALLIVCTAYLVDGSFSPFLYFRF